MNHLEFTVRGQVVGTRARMAVVAGIPRMYQPKERREYERCVQVIARAAVEIHEWEVPATDVPLRMDLTAYCPMPKSWSMRKKKAMWGAYAVTQPDRDNLMKLVCDALLGTKLGPRTFAGIVYKDDRQICTGVTERLWCFEGEERLLVSVRVLDRPLP